MFKQKHIKTSLLLICMRKKSFWHLPVNSDRQAEIEKVKKSMEDLGIQNPTYDEAVAILLEKNNKIKLSKSEVANIIKRNRGIDL